MFMTIADSVWLATALLHRENSHVSDFSVQEIIEKALAAKLVENYRPGLPVHASKHCVANKPPNPGRYRILVETTRGRRRLFRMGDSFHPDRRNGKTHPDRADIPSEYQSLIDWYETDYSKQSLQSEAGALKNNPGTNRSTTAMEPQPGIAFVGSAGAVIIPDTLRKDLKIEEGTRLSVRLDKDRIVLQPVNENLISKLRGSCKSTDSLVEAREREHRDDTY
jgi:AbrB family looped-hinge helix DNA binding protein